ncbi:hypothetical protein VB711_19920 [Cronbergia sp. UHCC 0137]|uniref:hypothetical protein n=1 Tax=Cronbergia sp. UHCC 0137 TaxID=3110239 RepID=UPI002B1F49ED|nr:hypothetical protein [Cronbergia sp. UHCC 0137]MEA5620094.1 hypothetical protein [Cronbergia sp. UHCC 0137]
MNNNNTTVAVPTAKEIQVSQNNLPKNIAQAVLKDASQRSGVKIADLKITQVTATTFGNACGFKFGEICTKEYKPIQGWSIVVNVDKKPWTYHVNKPGSQIVLDPQIIVSSATQLPENIADKILLDASQRSGLPINTIKIIQATPKTFSNSCVFNFGEVCAQIFDPIEGWIVTVQVKGQSWTYHVDQSGSRMVLDPSISN